MPGPRADRNSPITVGTVTVEPGRRRSLELPIARLSTGTWLNLPVEVTNGRYQGPRIWVSGAVHGDELNGVEIVRQLVRKVQPRSLAGTLIAVPIVNVFGFVNESRYLPDRRDLNRSFPGSPRGSLAARLAHLFLRTVVAHCDVGIDLHTAAGERVNVPQVRGEFDDPETRRLAEAFGAPFLIEARLRDGSLRQAATQMGKRVLVYEAGQVRRFEEHCIEVGTSGVLRTMEALGMGNWDVPAPKERPVRVRRTTWVRARRSGIALLDVELGEKVERAQVMGTISDALQSRPSRVTAPVTGWVIAIRLDPLVSQGDALVHVALADDAVRVRVDRGPESRSRARRGPETDPH